MYSQHEPPVNLVMFTIILTWECITLSKWVLPQLCMEYSHLYMGLHGLYTNMYYKPLTIWFVGPSITLTWPSIRGAKTMPCQSVASHFGTMPGPVSGVSHVDPQRSTTIKA